VRLADPSTGRVLGQPGVGGALYPTQVKARSPMWMPAFFRDIDRVSSSLRTKVADPVAFPGVEAHDRGNSSVPTV